MRCRLALAAFLALAAPAAGAGVGVEVGKYRNTESAQSLGDDATGTGESWQDLAADFHHKDLPRQAEVSNSVAMTQVAHEPAVQNDPADSATEPLAANPVEADPAAPAVEPVQLVGETLPAPQAISTADPVKVTQEPVAAQQDNVFQVTDPPELLKAVEEPAAAAQESVPQMESSSAQAPESMTMTETPVAAPVEPAPQPLDAVATAAQESVPQMESSSDQAPESMTMTETPVVAPVEPAPQAPDAVTTDQAALASEPIKMQDTAAAHDELAPRMADSVAQDPAPQAPEVVTMAKVFQVTDPPELVKPVEEPTATAQEPGSQMASSSAQVPESMTMTETPVVAPVEPAPQALNAVATDQAALASEPIKVQDTVATHEEPAPRMVDSVAQDPVVARMTDKVFQVTDPPELLKAVEEPAAAAQEPVPQVDDPVATAAEAFSPVMVEKHAAPPQKPRPQAADPVAIDSSVGARVPQVTDPPDLVKMVEEPMTSSQEPTPQVPEPAVTESAVQATQPQTTQPIIEEPVPAPQQPAPQEPNSMQSAGSNAPASQAPLPENSLAAAKARAAQLADIDPVEPTAMSQEAPKVEDNSGSPDAPDIVQLEPEQHEETAAPAQEPAKDSQDSAAPAQESAPAPTAQSDDDGSISTEAVALSQIPHQGPPPVDIPAEPVRQAVTIKLQSFSEQTKMRADRRSGVGFLQARTK